MTKKKVVLVGDVVKSGKIPDRSKYWNSLESTTKRINESYENALYAPITIIKGDEISAVLNGIDKIYQIINDFQNDFFPYQMRFVIVYGIIDVALDTKNASPMDGPAFRKADELLHELKKKKRYVKIDICDNTIDILLTTIANLVANIKSNWTSTEKEIIDSYKEHGKQIKVAKIKKITQQAVSDALQRSHWNMVRESEETIENVLKGYRGELND